MAKYCTDLAKLQTISSKKPFTSSLYMFITNHERNTQFSPFGHCNLHNQYAVKPEYRFYASTGLNQLEIALGNLNGNLLLKLQIKNSIFEKKNQNSMIKIEIGKQMLPYYKAFHS